MVEYNIGRGNRKYYERTASYATRIKEIYQTILQDKAACPLRASAANRIQSCYLRTLTDLPISGRSVQLRLLVRRFYSDNPACKRQIFAERFPSLTLPLPIYYVPLSSKTQN